MNDLDRTLSSTPTQSRSPRAWRWLPWALLLLVLIVSIQLIVGTSGGPRINRNERQTKLCLKALEGALNRVVEVSGTSPSTMTDFQAQAHKKPSTWEALEALPHVTDPTGLRTFTDGYGNAIRYHSPTNGHPAYFQSPGPDGMYDTVDDILSYEP